MQSEEEPKQSPKPVKIRQPYTVSDKKLEQLRIAREKCKKKREEEEEKKVLELLDKIRARERDEESSRLEKEQIEKQAAVDSSKIATAVEPQLSSTHIYSVPKEIKMEAKEEVAVAIPPVREVDIRQMTMPPAPELPRQHNVAWEDMQNAPDDSYDDAATALQQLRSSVPPRQETPLPGTGAGNHAPFENERGYRQAPYEPRPTQMPAPVPLQRSRPIPPRPVRQEENLDEQQIRFLSSLPRHTAARVLAAMMTDEEPDMMPMKRQAPSQVVDDYMSHARVAQTFHPSRLQTSLHNPPQEYGSQFVWM